MARGPPFCSSRQGIAYLAIASLGVIALLMAGWRMVLDEAVPTWSERTTRGWAFGVRETQKKKQEEKEKKKEKNTKQNTPASRIPRRLVFTHKENILETRAPARLYRNVRHTIDEYNRAWGGETEEVSFLTDSRCHAAIERAEPALVPHFEAETKGMYKADICRVAELWLRGGYCGCLAGCCVCV